MRRVMKLEKTADGYVVQVPDDVVAALGLHEGDEVKVAKSNPVTIPVTEEQRRWAMDTIRELRGTNPLPPGYKFDREEANAR